MNEIIPSNMKLKSFGDDLLDQFTKSVEENNWSEELEVIISQLVWLQDNNGGWQFEMSGPMAKEDACIGYVDEVVEVGILFEDGLEMTP